MTDYANLPFPGTKIEYPTKPKKNPLLDKRAGTLTAQELAAVYPELVAYQEATDAYQAQKTAYYQYQRDYEAFFKSTLETEHGVVGHPKADFLYSKAWEMGHSAGYNEVANYYSDFAELLS